MAVIVTSPATAALKIVITMLLRHRTANLEKDSEDIEELRLIAQLKVSRLLE
jgi:hypothetical protein